MKMSTVSLLVWLSQFLTACALHDNLGMTYGPNEVTVNRQTATEAATTNQKLRITTTTTTTTAVKTMMPQETTEMVSPQTEEFLTKWGQRLISTKQPSTTNLHVSKMDTQKSSANSVEKTSNTISNFQHKVISLGQTVSSKPDRLTSDISKNSERGTTSGAFTTRFQTEGSTRQNKDPKSQTNGSGTSIQADHTTQATSWTGWTEERTEGTEIEVNSTTLPTIISRNESEVKSDRGSYGSSRAQQGTYTTQSEQNTHAGNQTHLHKTTIGYIDAGTSSAHGLGYVTTPKIVNLTQVTSSKNTSILNTEWPPVSRTHAITATEVGTDQEIMANASVTERNVYTVLHTEDSVSTHNTETLPESNNGSYILTTGQNRTIENYNTTQTNLDIDGRNQTFPSNSTDESNTPVPSSEQDLTSQLTTAYVITTQVMSSDGKNISMQNTEGHVVSSTHANAVSTASANIGTDQKTRKRTEHFSTTQRPVHNITYTTLRDRTSRTEATHTQSDSIWSTFPVNTSESTEGIKNISRETEQTAWPDCFNTDSSSSQTHRSSQLFCFITLWSLAMTASVFLGLTIFLWARLSVVRKRAKQRARRYRVNKGSTRKERESLWASDGATAEERVEFWYANGSTLEADKKGKTGERAESAKKNGRKNKEGKEEDMWIQPKVTMQDITEFWYANGRGRNKDRMERQNEMSGQ